MKSMLTRLTLRQFPGVLFFATVIAFSLCFSLSTQAATLTWDNSGTTPATPTDGSSSLWNTTATVWSNGSTDAAWVNANNDTAVFGNSNGTAGTVNLGTAITAGGITFNAATSGNYTIAGGSGPFTLTLGGATPTITANVAATISAAIAGSAGLTKAGTGLLTLSGANTYTNGTVISSGTLSVNVNGNLGSSALTADKNLTIMNGATFQWTGGASGFNRNFILGSGTSTMLVDTGATSLFGGTISFTGAGARTLVLDGATIGGQLGGLLADNGGEVTSLTKNGTGLWILNGANTYTGDTRINAGTLVVGTTVGAKLPTTSTVRVNTGATLRIDNTSAQTIGNLQDGAGGGGIVSMNVSGTTALTIQSGSFSGVLKDQAAGTKVLALNKTTSGTLTLSGNNTYTGGTTVSAGALIVNGTTASSAFTVNGTGTLGGSGKVGTLDIKSGGTVSPGNSPGTLSAGVTTFESGGKFTLQMNNDGGIGSAGTNWDKLAITGSLDLTGLTSGAPFILTLQTLDGTNAPNPLGTFDNTQNHTWAGFVTTTTGITNPGGVFNKNLFSIDTTGFKNTLNGSFSVAQNGNNLDLIYTAVPEPSTYAMALGGFGVLLGLQRMRRRSHRM